MFAVGISFMMMGSVKYIVMNKMNTTLPLISQRLYTRMFYSGVAILLLSVISIWIPTPYANIPPSLPVFYMSFYALRIINKELLKEDEEYRRIQNDS